MKYLLIFGLASGLLLLALIQTSEIENPSVEKTLYKGESDSFQQLATMLHGATTVDVQSLREIMVPLFDQVRVERINNAIAPLQRSILNLPKANIPILYQDVMIAWYFTAPKNALDFLFQSLSGELSKIELKQADSHEMGMASIDFRLLLDFLNFLISKNGASVISHVDKDISKKASWVNGPQRRDFDYYTLSLELDWLRTILLVRSTTLPTIIQSVDFMVQFQQKTIAIRKFKGQQGYDETIDLISSMQVQMAQQVLSGLKGLNPKIPKSDQVQKVMEDVVTLASEQPNAAVVLPTVLQALQTVSRMLHSLPSQ